VNESKQIFKVIIVFIIAAGAIFGITLGVLLDHFIEEIIVVTGYWVSMMAIYNYYFWPKCFLLLQGADLDKNFQIVYANAEKGGIKIEEGTNKEEQIEKAYLRRMPKTMEECKVCMEALDAWNMILTQRATGSSRSLSQSRGGSFKSYASQMEPDTAPLLDGGGMMGSSSTHLN